MASKKSLTTDQAGIQLTRHNHIWGTPGEFGDPEGVTFAFRATQPAYTLTESPVQETFTQFSSEQITATLEAFQLWADLANISFARIGEGTDAPDAYSDEAQILLGNYQSDGDNLGGFAFSPDVPFQTGDPGHQRPGDVWINLDFTPNFTVTELSYGFWTLLHEIGHALGLEHPADYDAKNNQSPTYGKHAQHVEDSLQYTVMSYFEETFTKAEFGGLSKPSAPMLHDVAAIQRLYGANMSTRTGDDIYGWNGNTGRDVFTITSQTVSDGIVAAIWDAGGNDTIDMSLYFTFQTIDLREEHFSSTGGRKFNIAIAKGTVIENAIGGFLQDTLIGNDVANILIGGGGGDDLFGNGGDDMLIGGGGDHTFDGDDILDGGAGSDTVDYRDVNVGININLALTGSQTIIGSEQDKLKSIENIIGTNFDDILADGQNSRNILSGLAGNDTLISSGAPLGLMDRLEGGDGNDTYQISSAIIEIVELAGEGDHDKVVSITNFTLPGEVEDLTLTGNAANGIGNGLANIMEGNNRNNTLEGLAGNDWLIGGVGIDTLLGGEDDDILDGGAGADILDGGEGNDTLFISSADLFGVGVNGGNGIDTLMVIEAKALTFSSFAVGTGSVEKWIGNGAGILGTNADNVFDFSELTAVTNLGPIDGGLGDDTITGTAFADSLVGGMGNDTLNGGDGNDVLRPGPGIDIVNGGDGHDIISYEGSKEAVTITLLDGGEEITGVGGDADGDMITNVEGAIGGSGNDVLTGSSGDNTFNGGLGADTINGGDGDDFIEVSGIEALSDILNPGEGGETFGDSLRVVGSGPVFFLGFDAGALGFERWLGNDKGVMGSGAADVFDLSAVTTVANLGYIDLGGGDDVIIGADLSVIGEDLRGGSGNDKLFGLAGNDDLDGGFGNDELFGGAGADELTGGPGSDILNGGSGPNTYFITYTDAVGDTFIGGANLDRIFVTGDAKTNLTLLNFDSVSSSIEWWLGSGQAVFGDANNNVLDFGNIVTLTDLDNVSPAGAIAYIDGQGGDDVITGTQLNDDLRGGADNDQLNGSAGDDTLNGVSGNDVLHGGVGNDTLLVSGKEAAFDDLFGDDGFDTIIVLGKSVVSLHMFSTVDYSIESWIGNGKGVVGVGDDVLDFSNLTSMSNLGLIDGGKGDDIITGSFNNDLIKTGAGDDTVHYGLGFGIDTVFDFKAGGTEDQIDLTRISTVSSLADLQALVISELDASTLSLRFNGNDILNLDKVKFDQLTDDDFIFAAPNEAPTDLLVDGVSSPNLDVDENAPPGTVLGTLSSEDVNAFETFTYVLTDDAGGLFRIDGDEIVVNAALDFENAASHDITVEVTDGSGATYEETFTIEINDVVDGGGVLQAASLDVVNTPPFDTNYTGSQQPAISADGNVIAFIATGSSHIFMYDLASGETRLVSHTAADTDQVANSDSFEPGISADGRFVVYVSFATDLDFFGGNEPGVYVYDREADGGVGASFLVSLDNLGTAVSSTFLNPAISGDGRYVVYSTFGDMSGIGGDTNFGLDIYLFDRQDQHVERISNGLGLGVPNVDPAISADGRYVAFSSQDDLSGTDSDSSFDIYVYDRVTTTTTFIGDASSLPSQDPSISASGQLIVFDSLAALDPADTNGASDIYLYDQLTQAITLVSTPDGMTLADGNSTSASISADGNYVTFQSLATNLVAGDNNGVADVFVYSVADGSITRVSVDEQGDELVNGGITPTISGNGATIGFATADPLVAEDGNFVSDIYIATDFFL